MNRKRLFLLYGFLLVAFNFLQAQVTFTGKQLGSDFNRAMELYNKEKYAAAIKLFDSFLAEEKNINSREADDASYFSAVSAINLFNPDGEYRMLKYLAEYPESPRINDSRLILANYFYQNKNYRKAASYYETVNRQHLKKEELPEYFFRYGYSLYSKGDQGKALVMFSEIKDIDTEYTPPALYYYSQIAYEQKMYQSAMEGFMKLKDDETFGAVVPFYIVQILYLDKDYDGILKIAPDLLKSAGKERSIELYRFIGDAHYNKGNFKEALVYLQKYTEGAKASERADKYQLGYCYYKTGDIDNAIKIFLETGAGNDLISQNIWNLLGDCYLQKSDKPRARLAFGEASKMSFDKSIQEESLFNFAKLTYETSYSPFGETIAAFTEYIQLYPGSERIQDAYDYLVATYLQMKNYKAALASLDKIAKKDKKLEEAYQRVAFYRGLELFRNLEMEAAIGMFDKSLKYEKYDRTLRAKAVYWRGEAWYRLAHYDKAQADYEMFMGIPGSMSVEEYKMVRYNLGSALYNLKDYQNALIHLKNFELSSEGAKPEVIADALNRIADCYFITTDYKTAIEYYDKVIAFGNQDADYAMFQKGFSLGLTNDNRGKTDVLSALLVKYPSSSIVPNAIFERGRAYMVLEDFTKGETDFNTVINDYPGSPFVPRAIVQLGLLYYNTGQNEKAVAQYKKVIENYKSTPESRYALTGLKNSYVDMNDVEAYFSYVKTLEGYGDVNMAQKDSLLYTSGENLYIASNYEKASEVFSNYLTQFPEGSFRLSARFYLAECLRMANKTDEALKLYEEVSAEENNQFLEQSLLAASEILFGKEEFEESLEYYRKLELAASNDVNRLTAYKGQLQSASFIGDAQSTIAAANKITAMQNIPEELLREAVFMRAKANYSLNNYDEALNDFKRVGTEVTSIEGAESKYRIAELLEKQNKNDESERVIQEFIDQKTPHQYWMGRIFLLLADLSQKKGDLFQARITLQSLRDYYEVDNDGILDEVKAKLASLDEKKQQ
jgi:TolA-binding protein